MLSRIETLTGVNGDINCTRWLDDTGKLHRDDNPAVIWTAGVEQWYTHGNAHREDGPAVIDLRENTYYTWYLNGVHIINYEEFQKITNCDDEYIIFLKLKWGKI